jgi:hypothetical protein
MEEVNVGFPAVVTPVTPRSEGSMDSMITRPPVANALVDKSSTRGSVPESFL